MKRLKQWWCGRSKKSKYIKGHLRGQREKLVGARYRIKCTRCDKVLFEDTNMNNKYDRQKPKSTRPPFLH